MKIKLDFVTNSSSTCYVLTSTVSGKLPCLGDLEKLKKFHNGGYFSKGYVQLRKEDEEDMDPNDMTVKAYNFNIILNNTVDWKQNTEVPITIFNMAMKNFNPYNYPQLELTKEILEDILFKHLKFKGEAFQLSYHGWPCEYGGDGWDGGDPLGPSDYEWTYDLFENETEIGILTVVNNHIVTEVSGVSEVMSLNQIALDTINANGVIVREHNDKNS